MLALHDSTTVFSTFREGGWVTDENGKKLASPAAVGMTFGDRTVSEIQDADEIPAGKRSTGRAVQIVSGVPKWVHALEDVPPPSPEEISAEVKRRIFAKASQTAQMNMAAARAAGLMDANAQAAFVEALTWVAQMRAKGAELAAAQDATYRDDSHWPEPSAAAVALAAQF